MMVQSFPGSPMAASSDPMFWNKGPAPGLTFLSSNCENMIE